MPDPDEGGNDTEYTGKVYTLNIGSKVYDQDSISDPVYSASAPNHGMYGISTDMFSCDIFTGVGQEKNILRQPSQTVVIFSELKNVEFILTNTTSNRKGVVSITAYTKFVNTDIVMTAETFLKNDIYEKPQSYPCTRVVAAALSEIYNTGGTPASIGEQPYLYVSEFKDKSVRSVLEEISKVNGGYFFDNNGAPDFAVNGGDAKGSIMVTADEYSPTSDGTLKTVSKVFVSDNLNNATYEVGNGEYYNTETLSGAYLMGETICRQAAAKMFGQYEGWQCDNILIDNFTPVLHTSIRFSGNTHIADNISVKYTKNHSIMSAGADGFSLAYADYTDQKQRAIDSKLTTNKTYSNSGFNTDLGFYFSMEKTDSEIMPLSDGSDNSGRIDNYYFTTKPGGLTSYDGVMSSKKEAEKITVDRESGKVTVTYTDGHKYTYSANVTEASGGYEINNETEEWE